MSAAGAICGIFGASIAVAEPVVELEPLRSWSVPIQISPHTAHIDAGVDGAYLMMSRSEGAGEEPSEDEMNCLVAVSNAERALSFEVRYEYAPTRCVDAVLGPDGGFILRGEVLDVAEGKRRGFTSRIDAGGDILWSVPDEKFVDGDEGQFAGDWVEAMEGLAYDEAEEHVFALTMGQRQLGNQQRSLIQAHFIDAESGELIESGMTFGSTDNDIVEDLVARNGEFLVVSVDETGEETRFYSHEVGLGAFRFEPDELDWTVYGLAGPVEYRREAGTFYLWRRGDGDEFGVTRVEGLDEVVWTASFDATGEVDGRNQYLGEPDRLWVSDEFVVIRHDVTGQHPYLRFLHREDGAQIAIVSRGELTTYDELDIVYGEGGKLVLLAINPMDRRLWEYGVELVDGEGAAGVEDGDGENEGGCISSPGAPQAVLAMVMLVAWGIGRRTVIVKVTGAL